MKKGIGFGEIGLRGAPGIPTGSVVAGVQVTGAYRRGSQNTLFTFDSTLLAAGAFTGLQGSMNGIDWVDIETAELSDGGLRVSWYDYVGAGHWRTVSPTTGLTFASGLDLAPAQSGRVTISPVNVVSVSPFDSTHLQVVCDTDCWGAGYEIDEPEPNFQCSETEAEEDWFPVSQPTRQPDGSFFVTVPDVGVLGFWRIVAALPRIQFVNTGELIYPQNGVVTA